MLVLQDPLAASLAAPAACLEVWRHDAVTSFLAQAKEKVRERQTCCNAARWLWTKDRSHSERYAVTRAPIYPRGSQDLKRRTGGSTFPSEVSTTKHDITDATYWHGKRQR